MVEGGEGGSISLGSRLPPKVTFLNAKRWGGGGICH